MPRRPKRCGARTKTGKCRNPAQTGFAHCWRHVQGSAVMTPEQVEAMRANGGPPKPAEAAPPKPAAHPNTAVKKHKEPPKLNHLKKVVLLDLDGTMYDAMACCGVRGNFRSSATCDHVRHDTVTALRELCQREGAEPVVLSWRAGLVDVSNDWLKKIGLRPAAVFIPGSKDDIANESPDDLGNYKKWKGGQVQFKVATMNALRARGVEVVGSFDDNKDVTDAFKELGVPNVTRVEHLVEVEDHEWRAGYIGAPKPKPFTPSSYSSSSSSSWAKDWNQKSLFEATRPGSRPIPNEDFGSAWHGWDDPDDLVDDDDDPGGPVDEAKFMRAHNLQRDMWVEARDNGGNVRFGGYLLGVEEDGSLVMIDDKGDTWMADLEDCWGGPGRKSKLKPLYLAPF